MLRNGHGQEESVLLVQGCDAAPGGVLGEEDDQDVEGGGRDDGEPAQDAEEPVAGAIATAGPGVGPAGQGAAPGRGT